MEAKISQTLAKVEMLKAVELENEEKEKQIKILKQKLDNEKKA
jgi:hypothetical protein